MSAILAWLDERGGEWIRQGLKRIPVMNKPQVGWSQTGKLIADASLIRAVGLDVDFTDQMQTHTIQFDGVDNQIASSGPFLNYITEAEILWSVKGTTIRRLVNVNDGQSVSGIAQAVSIRIRDVTPEGNGLEYTVGVSVTPGLRGNTQEPPTLRTTGIDNSASPLPVYFGTGLNATGTPGDTVIWTIPSNAGVISALVTAYHQGAALVDGDLLIQHRAANTSVLRTVGAESCNRWLPIYGGTRTIRVKNMTAGTLFVSTIFGIDG